MEQLAFMHYLEAGVKNTKFLFSLPIYLTSHATLQAWFILDLFF